MKSISIGIEAQATKDQVWDKLNKNNNMKRKEHKNMAIKIVGLVMLLTAPFAMAEDEVKPFESVKVVESDSDLTKMEKSIMDTNLSQEPMFDGHCALAVSMNMYKDVWANPKVYIIKDGNKYVFKNSFAKLLFRIIPGRRKKAGRVWSKNKTALINSVKASPEV